MQTTGGSGTDFVSIALLLCNFYTSEFRTESLNCVSQQMQTTQAGQETSLSFSCAGVPATMWKSGLRSHAKASK